MVKSGGLWKFWMVIALSAGIWPFTVKPQVSMDYESHPIIPENEVDCEEIWWWSGHGENFYEDNPTYIDDVDDTAFWNFSSPEEQGMDSEILSDGLAELDSSPYLFSILIIRHDTIVIENFFNGSEQNHSNNIHSSSKSMLPAMVGIAVKEGYIDSVDQKVSDFLPEYFTSGGEKENITIRHLMTMSAGLGWVEDKSEYQIEKTENWVEAILGRALVTTPGEEFNYSTGLTHVLSAVIGSATGVSTCEFAHRNLFEKIGIMAEHWGRDPQAVYSGGYNLYMTPREMAKFGLLYMHGGEWNSEQIIPPEMVEDSVSPQISAGGAYDYGYCWWLRRLSGYDTYIAWGFGGQFIFLFPELDLILVSTADTMNNPAGEEIDVFRFIRKYLIPSIEGIQKNHPFPNINPP